MPQDKKIFLPYDFNEFNNLEMKTERFFV